MQWLNKYINNEYFFGGTFVKGYHKFSIVLTVFLFFIGLYPVKIARSEEIEKNIIVLIDNSGSMNKNDNTRLSLVSASMLIDTVDLNKTKINVIAFGDKVSFVKRLSENPTAEELKSEIASIKYDNQYTNMKQGLDEALSQLNDMEGDKSIIVLSDGKEEVPGETAEEHEKKLNNLIRTAQEMNVRINTIGLSADSDKNALLNISSKTLGDYYFVENASGVFEVFSKIFGNMNGYYTIDRFSTAGDIDKSIKISPFVEEVVVNVVSSNDNFPTVNVSNENNLRFDYKSGDRYKIFKLKNDGSGRANSIRISSADGTASSVIIQIKSKVAINVNTSGDSFEIPYRVPLNIKALVEAEKEISDLQLYIIDEGEKKLLTKENNAFEFEFKKYEPGYYSIFLIACDGNGSIIAGKHFYIAVTSKVPFSYRSQLISPIYAGNDFEVSLEQQDSTRVRDAAGDIYVWYEETNEPLIFPIKYEGGGLYGKINLKSAGKVKLSAQIRGIKEEGNEPFFYYLPAMNAEIIEKPYIEFKAESFNRPFKEKENVQLYMLITENRLTEEEKLSLYDNHNKLIKSFTVKPGDSRAAVDLVGLEKGENFKFFIRTDDSDVVIGNVEVSTNIKVMSDLGHFWYRYKVILFILIALLLLTAAAALFFLAKYRNEVAGYSINKDIDVSIPDSGVKHSENVYLSTSNFLAYLNVSKKSIYLSSLEEPDYSIGYFVLKVPEGNKILQGISYLLQGEMIFEITYRAITEQYTIEGSPVTEMAYRSGEEIIAKAISGNKTIKIVFY